MNIWKNSQHENLSSFFTRSELLKNIVGKWEMFCIVFNIPIRYVLTVLQKTPAGVVRYTLLIAMVFFVNLIIIWKVQYFDAITI